MVQLRQRNTSRVTAHTSITPQLCATNKEHLICYVDHRELHQTEAQELTADELAEQDAAELPDREAMSLVNANLAAPVNAAVALNALSDNSTAEAIASQTAPINQSI
jgi:hypothetical protein